MDRLTLTRILGSETRLKKIDETSLKSRDSRLSKVIPNPLELYYSLSLSPLLLWFKLPLNKLFRSYT